MRRLVTTKLVLLLLLISKLGLATEPAPRASAWYDDEWGWVIVSAGASSAGFATAFALRGASLREDASNEANQFDAASFNRSANTFQTAAVVCGVLGGVGVAAGILTLALYEEPKSFAVNAGMGPGTVQITGRF